MKRLAALFLSVFLIIFSLPSCSLLQGETSSCREIVGAMAKAEIGLPAGVFYSSSAPKGDEEFLSNTLMCALFGNGSFSTLSKDWIDAAVFLSLKESPCEFAVILCASRYAAIDTAKLFSSRISAIKITTNDPKYKEMTETATATVIRNYAILIISTDPQNALKAAKKAIN